MNITEKIVKLEIYTWQGISLGATHYYVELHSWISGDRRSNSRLSRKLSKREAGRLNEMLRLSYSEKSYELYKVKPGDMDWRFETYQQALSEALKQWKIIFPEADKLVDYNNENKVYARR